MTRFFKKTFFLPGCFALSCFSFSQSALTVYNTNNSSVPNNNVTCIAVDPITNYIWFGTDNGLAVFDGSNFTTYNTSNSALTDNYIKTIYVDAQNNKWIGTVNGGVFKFDGSAWTNIKSSDGLLSDNVRAVAIDAGGIMWFGTSSGLCKYDGTTWTYFTVSNTNLFSDNITSIKILKDNRKVFSTLNGGMAYWNDTTMTIYDHWSSTLPENTVLDVEADTLQNVWVCMPSAGVTQHINGITWQWFSTSNSFILTDAVVDCHIEKTTNKAYFATQDAGMLEFVSGGFLSYDVNAIGLPQNYLNCLTQDNNGIFWLGTQDSGLVRFDKQQWVGLAENNKELFVSAFPNPATDEVTINGKTVFTKIELHDLLGNLVFCREFQPTKNIIFPVKEIERGCYVLTVSSSERRFNQKILISDK